MEHCSKSYFSYDWSTSNYCEGPWHKLPLFYINCKDLTYLYEAGQFSMKFLQPFTKKSVTQNNVLSGYLMISFLYFFASHIVIVIKINILIKTEKKEQHILFLFSVSKQIIDYNLMSYANFYVLINLKTA